MPVESARDLFENHMPKRLEAKPELVEKVNASYKFVVTGDNGGTWVVDLTSAEGGVREEDSDANCTITVDSGDLVDIVTGKLNGQMAFMTGKIKVAGDMALAMKLGSVLG
ncbi:MAG: SCP2 sterol-binding domain-containing protein [Myxococcota bacterium]|nr:SCP2 sterol-binding domain-containing protein [Myxococcota bacterium]